MADKSPHKPSGKKPGKTLKEKRTAKKLKRNSAMGAIQTIDQLQNARQRASEDTADAGFDEEDAMRRHAGAVDVRGGLTDRQDEIGPMARGRRLR